MSWTVKAEKGGNFVKCPPGNHAAVLVAIIDMGTQEHPGFQGGPTRYKRDVYLCWELPGEQIAGTTKNHVIGTALTFSFNEKATLRAWVEARTGKSIPDGQEYDISTEAGQPCLLNIKEKDGYPRIDSVAALPKGFPTPKASYPTTILTLKDALEIGVPEWIPWHMGSPLIEHIKASKEHGGPKPVRKAKPAQAEGVIGPDGKLTKDPIPF